MDFNVRFSDTPSVFTSKLTDGNTTVPLRLETGSAETSDHTKLNNRDLPNQHPITAITDLERELAEKLEEADFEELTNLDIIKLWNAL